MRRLALLLAIMLPGMVTLAGPASAGWLGRNAWLGENFGNYAQCRSGIATKWINVWWQSPSCASLVYGRYWSQSWSYCSQPWWISQNSVRCD